MKYEGLKHHKPSFLVNHAKNSIAQNVKTNTNNLKKEVYYLMSILFDSVFLYLWRYRHF